MKQKRLERILNKVDKRIQRLDTHTLEQEISECKELTDILMEAGFIEAKEQEVSSFLEVEAKYLDETKASEYSLVTQHLISDIAKLSEEFENIMKSHLSEIYESSVKMVDYLGTNLKYQSNVYISQQAFLWACNKGAEKAQRNSVLRSVYDASNKEQFQWVA